MDRSGYAIVAKCWLKKVKVTEYSLRKKAAHDPRIHFPVKSFDKIGLGGVSITQSGDLTAQDSKFTPLELARQLRRLPLEESYKHIKQEPLDPPEVED